MNFVSSDSPIIPDRCAVYSSLRPVGDTVESVDQIYLIANLLHSEGPTKE